MLRENCHEVGDQIGKRKCDRFAHYRRYRKRRVQLDVKPIDNRRYETHLTAVRHCLVWDKAMRRIEGQRALGRARRGRSAGKHQRRPSQARPEQRSVTRRTG